EVETREGEERAVQLAEILELLLQLFFQGNNERRVTFGQGVGGMT
ncbi:hypothetical protein DBR06_SOUSAS1710131, partial [Sousa chinensis]